MNSYLDDFSEIDFGYITILVLNSPQFSLHRLLYKYTVLLMILIAGDHMHNLSFAHYVLRCRSNPLLAHKSALQIYKRYQRAQTRPGWLNALLLWH